MAIYHKSTYYIGLKFFNSLPSHIKDKRQDIYMICEHTVMKIQHCVM